MTRSRKAELLPTVLQMRSEGYTLDDIEGVVGVSKETIKGWGLPRVRRNIPQPPRVMYDPQERCWFIYIHEAVYGEPVHWWPLRWLRFASERVAVAHLQVHGAQ